jgi:hypothetical protein
MACVGHRPMDTPEGRGSKSSPSKIGCYPAAMKGRLPQAEGIFNGSRVGSAWKTERRHSRKRRRRAGRHKTLLLLRLERGRFGFFLATRVENLS